MLTGTATGRQPAAESAHRVPERSNLPPEPPPPGQHHRSVSTQYLHNIYTVSTLYLHYIYTVSTQYLHHIYTISTVEYLSYLLLTDHSACDQTRGPALTAGAGINFSLNDVDLPSLTPAPPRYLGNLVSK